MNHMFLLGYSGATPGDSFRVHVWSDPDSDGTPFDAVLLASATGTIDAGSIDTDVLQSVPLRATVNGSFFIGISFAHDPGYSPAPFDSSALHATGRAWATWNGPTYDPTYWDIFNTVNLESDLWVSGAWLLRAEFLAGSPENDCNGNGIPDDCELCGDLDSDGDVDYDDYVIFLDAFGGVTDGIPAVDWCCDYDGSGAVGMADFDAWLSCYRSYVNDPLAGPPTIGKRRIRVPLSPLPKRGFSPAPSP